MAFNVAHNATLKTENPPPPGTSPMFAIRLLASHSVGRTTLLEDNVSRIGLMVLLVALTLTGCTTNSTLETTESGVAAASYDAVPQLDPQGWTTSVYEGLTEVIKAGAGKGNIAVFDFDNTTQARDITEAILAEAEQSGVIDPSELSEELFPAFSNGGGDQIAVSDGLFDYYEGLLATGEDVDPLREYSSIAVTGNVFAGRTVAEYLDVAAAAYDGGAGASDIDADSNTVIGKAGRPFIYPQMADLYGNLRAHDYEVWIVSAGIIWGVRWMVANALNPLIEAKYGLENSLPMTNIIAVNTLMRDTSTGALVSDYQLASVSADDAYLNLEPQRTASLEITSLPGTAVSWRGGKRGAIADIITPEDVYLASGDSNGDLPMLTIAKNRLVINRMDKPQLAESFASTIAQEPQANWFLQPTLTGARAGFLSDKCVMAERTEGDPDLTATTDVTMKVLEGTGRLGSYLDC
jgi:phosphoserine phosphatase